MISEVSDKKSPIFTNKFVTIGGVVTSKIMLNQQLVEELHTNCKKI